MSERPYANEDEDVTRVRFAPSPTGHLHIGGARTALFNWLFARGQGGRFILRSEDTDRDRSTRAYEEEILADLSWLGLDWDEGPDVGGEHGPYRQSQRLHLYEEAAQRLIKNELAYYCFCSADQLAASRAAARAAGRPWRYDGRCRSLAGEEKERLHLRGQGAAIRVKAPTQGETVVDDGLRGPVTFANQDIFDDFILVRSNGRAAYNFACVVDDMEMSISHVIRGDDHLSNTPRQLFLYEALEMEPPRFIHLPLILGADGERLSKRHGATSVTEFRQQGFLPVGLLNYLARLGWSYDGEREIFNRDELVAAFSLERVSTNPAVFDLEKARWVNGHHLRELAVDAFSEAALPVLVEKGWYDEDAGAHEQARVRTILAEVQDRLRTIRDVADHVDYFFAEPDGYEADGAKKHFSDGDVGRRLELVAQVLEQVEPWDRQTIEKAVRGLIEELDVGSRKVIHPTRLAISGRTFTPGLFITIQLIGREASVARLRQAVQFTATQA